MGRYYEGDIEGKFWFGVQSSDDGEFFGAQEQESNYIDYYVDKEKFKEIFTKTWVEIKRRKRVDNQKKMQKERE